MSTSPLYYYTFKDKMGSAVVKASNLTKARDTLAATFVESADVTMKEAKRMVRKMPMVSKALKDPNL